MFRRAQIERGQSRLCETSSSPDLQPRHWFPYYHLATFFLADFLNRVFLDFEQADAETLRHSLSLQQATAGSSHSSAVNGDAAGTAGGGGAAVTAQTDSLKGELQRTLEALRTSESSRLDVEKVLAEAQRVRCLVCMMMRHHATCCDTGDVPL